ncbi:ankyrin repeat-containing domain protein [Coprinopsis sp. MPI-PUGE-AT-0042]|nr:ankyrin repeat-containing domain protein [Coprinopsis sp. MPI-PUGE-AT-0042]
MGICRGLVNVEEGTNIVRYVHYTAKDVVKGLISELSPYPHSLLALVCMALLTERGFQRTSFGVDSSLKRALKAKSLLAYAYNNWSTHAHKSLDDTAVAFQLSQFIQGCRAFPLWLSKQRLSATLSDDPFIDDIFEPLHMLLSLPGILVNVIDEGGNTPLIQAASCSEEGSLSLLLAHPKINVNAANFFVLTALMSAASEEETTLLLAHPKIKPNQLDPEGRTALMNASFHGRLSVVQALLADARVKINLNSGIDIPPKGLFTDDIPYNEVIELLRTHSNREHFHSRNPLKNLLRRALPIAWKK